MKNGERKILLCLGFEINYCMSTKSYTTKKSSLSYYEKRPVFVIN